MGRKMSEEMQVEDIRDQGYRNKEMTRAIIAITNYVFRGIDDRLCHGKVHESFLLIEFGKTTRVVWSVGGGFRFMVAAAGHILGVSTLYIAPLSQSIHQCDHTFIALALAQYGYICQKYPRTLAHHISSKKFTQSPVSSSISAETHHVTPEVMARLLVASWRRCYNPRYMMDFLQQFLTDEECSCTRRSCFHCELAVSPLLHTIIDTRSGVALKILARLPLWLGRQLQVFSPLRRAWIRAVTQSRHRFSHPA